MDSYSPLFVGAFRDLYPFVVGFLYDCCYLRKRWIHGGPLIDLETRRNQLLVAGLSEQLWDCRHANGIVRDMISYYRVPRMEPREFCPLSVHKCPHHMSSYYTIQNGDFEISIYQPRHKDYYGGYLTIPHSYIPYPPIHDSYGFQELFPCEVDITYSRRDTVGNLKIGWEHRHYWDRPVSESIGYFVVKPNQVITGPAQVHREAVDIRDVVIVCDILLPEMT